MLLSCIVQGVVPAKRGSADALLLRVAERDGRIYEVPVSQFERLAIQDALTNTVMPFSPHDEMWRLIDATGHTVSSIRLMDHEDIVGYQAIAIVLCFGRETTVMLRAGSAIVLALRAKAVMFVSPTILERLSEAPEVSFEKMKPVNSRVF